MNIIGIDCATKQRKIGLALASFQNGITTVRSTKIGSETKPALEIVKDWLVGAPSTVIALDAPLGWPIELGINLLIHKAGERIDVNPDMLFSRYTDREVWRRLHKKPFEVGANLIARTSHAALHLLGDLRQETGLAIPLALNPDRITETCAIEVYPGATLQAMGVKKEQRLSMIRDTDYLTMGLTSENLASDHGLDAVVCVLSALDFLTGKCLMPTANEQKLAEKEGWIWVRSKEALPNY